MKIITPLKTLFISSLLSVSSLSSHAAIIDFGTYFSDSETGLDWLDVTATVNTSYNDISSQLTTGGKFEGWRYATGSEFNQLLFNWTGIAPVITSRTITTGTSPSVDGLISLFGSTLDSRWTDVYGQTWDNQNGYSEGEGLDFTLGIIADLFNNSTAQRQVAAIWDNEINGAAIDFYSTNHRQVLVDDAKNDIGSFLVRGSYFSNNNNGSTTSVAEPKTILLFSLGLMGLFFTRRKTSK